MPQRPSQYVRERQSSPCRRAGVFGSVSEAMGPGESCEVAVKSSKRQMSGLSRDLQHEAIGKPEGRLAPEMGKGSANDVWVSKRKVRDYTLHRLKNLRQEGSTRALEGTC